MGRHCTIYVWIARIAWAGFCVTGAVACNPNLLPAVGQSSISNLVPPDGYIAIVLMNKTPAGVSATLQINKQNGFVTNQVLSTGALSFFVYTQDCDVASIQFQTFTDGINITPANLGILNINESIHCGSVLAVTATGSPPTFSVEVF